MANVGKGTPSDPNQGWSLYIVSVVMVIISGIFVSLRVAIRMSKKMMGADDYIIIAVAISIVPLNGLISLVILSLTECLAVVNGYGKHNASLSHSQKTKAFKWFYGAQIAYKIAVCLYKESILFLYLRIFPARRFRIMTYIMIGVVTASGIAFTLVTIWQCSPIAAFWDKTIIKNDPSSHCFSSVAFWFSYSMLNIFLDILILILPIHEVIKLRLPLREKLELIGVFSLGGFVCATSIMRTTTLYASSHSKDTSWGYIPATVWSVVEANTGTICNCLPMLRRTLAQLFPKIFGSASHPTSGHSSTNYPLAAMRERNRESRIAGDKWKFTDGRQWAKSDGIFESLKKHGQHEDRASEERFTGLDVPGGRIARTTDVDVIYGSRDSDSIPSLKNDVHAG